jgi:PleD family two-component response regulator
MARRSINELILLIDENADNRAILGDMLRSRGYRVINATSTAKELSQAAELSPELILLATVPRQNAIECVQEIRTNDKLKDIPILLLLTPSEGKQAAKIKAMARTAGVNDFISLPIEEVELLARIANLIELQRARDQLADYNAELDKKVSARTELLEQALRGQKELLNEVQEVRSLWLATFNVMIRAIRTGITWPERAAQ